MTRYAVGCSFRLHNPRLFGHLDPILSCPHRVQGELPGGDWDWSAFKIGHLPHLRKLAIRWFSIGDAPPSTISFMPQLITLTITAANGRTFQNAATTLLPAAPNLERLCLCQNDRGADTTDTGQQSWLRPLIREEQDSEAVACPRLVVLRLCKIVIPQWDLLRKIGSQTGIQDVGRRFHLLGENWRRKSRFKCSPRVLGHCSRR